MLDEYPETVVAAEIGLMAMGAYSATTSSGLSWKDQTGAIKISGYKVHGLNQAISRDGTGVSPWAILDAVNNPVRVVQQPERGTVKYVGQYAVVVLSELDKVVTTYAKTRGAHRNK